VEYGSGMGRILRALRDAGYDCAGIDISPTMLENSRRLVPDVTDLHLLDASGRTDLPSSSAEFVFSYAVLQHIAERTAVRTAIGEMCRLLRRDGLLKLQFQPATLPFHVPFRERQMVVAFNRRTLWFRWCSLRGRRFVPAQLERFSLPLVFLRRHGNWSGVPLPWRSLERLLNQNGVRLLGLERDPGASWNSVWALGRKDL
jgi:SAM-dependent methyltransferase